MMSAEKASVISSKGNSHQRPVPWRTCLICGSKSPKRELIRLVRSAQGEIEIDLRGRLPGRGAYLCRAQRCWQAALKSKRLEHALRAAEVTTQKRQELSQFSQTLFS